jgi:hypothetical protein
LERIGDLRIPSGTTILLDAKLLPLWNHDAPLRDEAADFRIEGIDAERAGRKLDRQWHPCYLFDVPTVEVEGLHAAFAECVSATSLEARLVQLPERVRHRRRVELALGQGNGAGEVLFQGVWACVIRGLPIDRPVPLFGRRMPDGPDAARWQEVILEGEPGVQARRTERVGFLKVAGERLLLADVDALGIGAERLIDEAHTGGGSARILSTTWNDGVFVALRDFDAAGSLLRVRIELGTDDSIGRQRRREEFASSDFARYAIVSGRILREGAPVAWLYREQPESADDSGWRLLAGDESEDYLDDPRNAHRVPLRELPRLEERLTHLLGEVVGSAFERSSAGEVFVRTDAPTSE